MATGTPARWLDLGLDAPFPLRSPQRIPKHLSSETEQRRQRERPFSSAGRTSLKPRKESREHSTNEQPCPKQHSPLIPGFHDDQPRNTYGCDSNENTHFIHSLT